VSGGSAQDRAQLLGPRHWPAWLGIGTLRLLTALPLPLQPPLGAALGTLLGRALPARARVVRRNLELCLPELAPAARERLLVEHFRALGRGLLGLGLAWWGSGRRLRGLADITGLAHLDAARAQGRGVLLLSGHFTDLELGGRLLALERPFHVMYRPHEHPVMEHLMRGNRTRHFERAIPRDDARGLLRSLRAGHVVWYAPDQRHGGAGSVTVPFFGQPAEATTATARFAGIARCPVVPFFPSRIDGTTRLRLTIAPALEGFPSGDRVADTARVLALIEAQARRVPEQYWWVHRRFKSRSPERPDPYG
jgi:KDO2-lipid IV(A) lauroyltransferase